MIRCAAGCWAPARFSSTSNSYEGSRSNRSRTRSLYILTPPIRAPKPQYIRCRNGTDRVRRPDGLIIPNIRPYCRCRSYRAGLFESDPIKLNTPIEAARRSIRQRQEQIEDSRDAREVEQLNHALGTLFTLAARKRS